LTDESFAALIILPIVAR